jgi:hypothetical protein
VAASRKGRDIQPQECGRRGSVTRRIGKDGMPRPGGGGGSVRWNRRVDRWLAKFATVFFLEMSKEIVAMVCLRHTEKDKNKNETWPKTEEILWEIPGIKL